MNVCEILFSLKKRGNNAALEIEHTNAHNVFINLQNVYEAGKKREPERENKNLE